MTSQKKVTEAAKYAMDHMPMKTYPLLVVKTYDQLDDDEKSYASSTLNTNDLPTKAAFAFLSITVCKKEFTNLATAASPDEAARRVFAQSLTDAAGNKKLFDALVDFAKNFIDGLDK